MKLRSRLAVAVAVSAAIAGSTLAVSTTSAQAAGKPVIAMITHSDDGTFWSVVKKGATRAAQQLGVTLQWDASNNDAQKQAQYILAAVSQHVAGIAISIPNPDAIKAAVAKAVAAHIPVVSLNSGSNDFAAFGAITHVGQDENVAGAGAGKRFAAAGAKHLLCVIQEQSNQGLEQRCDGAKSTFGGTVDKLYTKGDADITTSTQQVAAKLSADKTIDAVLAEGPVGATEAMSAVKSTGSKAIIGNFDLDPKVLDGIKSGQIAFAVDQQQYLQGYLAVSFLWLNITNANTVGGGLPVMTGPGFVTKDNVAKVQALTALGTR